MSRLEEILTLAKKEINILTSRLVDYTIITGGTSNFANFNYIADEVFNKKITIGNIKLVGIRNNKYAACVGNIVYFISKLKLKGQSYTMVSERDEDDLISAHRNGINISNDTMIGKVFGYFFSE
jgi:cell division ATPase FtsA